MTGPGHAGRGWRAGLRPVVQIARGRGPLAVPIRWTALALVWVAVAAPGPTRADAEVAGVASHGAHEVGGRSLAPSGLGTHRYRLMIQICAMAPYVDPSATGASATTRGVKS